MVSFFSKKWDKFIPVVLSLLSFVPIFTFMSYSRVRGILGTCDISWAEPFYVGAVLAIAIILVQYASRIIMDRLMLGANLFLIIAAIAFFFNIQPCLLILGDYKGPFFMGSVLLAGIITTFFTKPGFIGIPHEKPAIVWKKSLLLLFFTFLGFLWSIITNNQGLVMSAIVPFIALRFVADYFQKKK